MRMSHRVLVLVLLLGFVTALVYGVQPAQRLAVLAALPPTLAAIAALYLAVTRSTADHRRSRQRAAPPHRRTGPRADRDRRP
jgi:hypothetical protein